MFLHLPGPLTHLLSPSLYIPVSQNTYVVHDYQTVSLIIFLFHVLLASVCPNLQSFKKAQILWMVLIIDRGFQTVANYETYACQITFFIHFYWSLCDVFWCRLSAGICPTWDIYLCTYVHSMLHVEICFWAYSKLLHHSSSSKDSRG